MLARLRVPLSWSKLIKRTIKACIADDILSLAAQQAFYFFFALFPALLTLVSFASFFPIENLAERLVEFLGRFMPGDVVEIITDQIAQISESNRGGILTFAFVLALWTSSTAMVSITTTLNAAYGVTETRQWWRVRLTAIAITIGLAIFILTSLTLVLVGPALAERVAEQFNLGEAFKWGWWILQWPLVFMLVATGVGIVYYFAPDAEQEWVWLTPGSVLATVLWLLASLGFRTYLQFFGGYNETYGAIGAIIIALTWFYLTALAILVGAELNAEIEHASAYGKDVGEKFIGEKKKIGAAPAAEEHLARADQPASMFPEGVNCDLEGLPKREAPPVRTSDLIIGAAALLPVALKLGREVRKKVSANETPDNRAA